MGGINTKSRQMKIDKQRLDRIKTNYAGKIVSLTPWSECQIAVLRLTGHQLLSHANCLYCLRKISELREAFPNKQNEISELEAHVVLALDRWKARNDARPVKKDTAPAPAVAVPEKSDNNPVDDLDALLELVEIKS
jgi:hypothetical protein